MAYISLGAMCRELGYRSYQAYLNGKHWSDFKQKYRESKYPQCCLVCGSSRYDLHHVIYERLGAELLCDVRPLCEDHHGELHKRIKQDRRKLSDTDVVINEMGRYKRFKESKSKPVERSSGKISGSMLKKLRDLKRNVLALRLLQECSTLSDDRPDLFEGLDTLVENEDYQTMRKRFIEAYDLEIALTEIRRR